MADQDDFRLEEEGEDLFAEAGTSTNDRSQDLKREQQLRDNLHHVAVPEAEEPGDDQPTAGFEPSPVSTSYKRAESGKSSGTRIILLVVLLLVVAGGAGYFYLGLSPEPAQPERPTPPQQPIAVPPRPQPAPAPLKAGPPATKETPPEASPPVTTQEVPASRPSAVETVPAPPAPSDAKPVPAPVEGTAPVVPVKQAPVAAAPVQEGSFYLQAGTYLNAGRRQAAETKIRDLGYRPETETVKKPVAMTRLLNGLFPPAQGAARLAELRKIESGAFVLRREGQLAVFAGSFSNQENAHETAAKFRAAGFQISEEQTSVELPVTSIRFGPFADRAAAEKAAEKAHNLGLEVEIARSR